MIATVVYAVVFLAGLGYTSYKYYNQIRGYYSRDMTLLMSPVWATSWALVYSAFAQSVSRLIQGQLEYLVFILVGIVGAYIAYKISRLMFIMLHSKRAWVPFKFVYGTPVGIFIILFVNVPLTFIYKVLDYLFDIGSMKFGKLEMERKEHERKQQMLEDIDSSSEPNEDRSNESNTDESKTTNLDMEKEDDVKYIQ